MERTERLCDLREIKRILNLKENTIKSLEYCGGILFQSKGMGYQKQNDLSRRVFTANRHSIPTAGREFFILS